MHLSQFYGNLTDNGDYIMLQMQNRVGGFPAAGNELVTPVTNVTNSMPPALLTMQMDCASD